MSKKTKASSSAPASVPAEGRTGFQPVSPVGQASNLSPTNRAQAAPNTTANPKLETRNSKLGEPAPAELPNEAQIADHFLAELEGSLPADMEGVAPKPATRRPKAQDQPGDDTTGANQEAPAGDDDSESDTSDQSDQSDPTAQADDDAQDEPGAPGQETTNEDEAEGDPLDEEDLTALAALDEAALDAHANDRQWPPSYLKRVKKFTKQLRAAEAETLRLREQLDTDENEPTASEPGTRNPELGTARGGAVSARESQIAAEIAQHEEWLDRIDEVEPGGSLVVGEQTFGPVALKKARRALETKLSARTIALEAAQQEREDQIRAGEAEAMVRYPWLKDRSNPDTAVIQNAMHQYPALAQIPNIRRLLADALSYRKLLEKVKAKGAAAPNGTANGHGQTPSPLGGERAGVRGGPSARTPGRPAAAVLPAPRRGPDLGGRLAKVMETGNRHDAESLVMDLVEK